MSQYVLSFQDIDQTHIAVVGGKGARQGELSRIKDVHVPEGFCVTTDAFQRFMAEAPSIDERLDSLSRLESIEQEAIRAHSAAIRQTLAETALPDTLMAAFRHALVQFGERASYAVRSSATAEDLPMTSFAGQHDTFLNIVGLEAILLRIRQCWASLFTERAVTYRLRNGIDQRKISMAVVVQRMVFSQTSGILFTADPITGARNVASVEASFGLGEALVSGLVNPDVYKVRAGEVISRTIRAKQVAIHAATGGGTEEQAIEPERQSQPALTDGQVVRLAQLGRQIEAHFDSPQDIEWGLVDNDFQIVQSRPITTLFPIPTSSDHENHVYVSVGHGQMMTDAMKPLGLSLWQLTAARPMYVAGGRLFVDVTQGLASKASRAGLLEALGKGDPLIADALRTLLDRGDFIPSLPDASPSERPSGALADGALASLETDPTIVTELIGRSKDSIAALKRSIRTKAGSALLDFIMEDIQELRRILFDPQSIQVIMAGMEASWWLNDHLWSWLGEKNAADELSQSVPYNITSEMGLALLDVADVIRPHPEVVEFLRGVKDEDFLDRLPRLAGGQEARDAIQDWLDMYGMRCVGEIDITRPRWSEHPTTLLPMILSDIRNFTPGAARRRFEQGKQEAWTKEQELLERLRVLPDGEVKAAEVKRMIDRVRTFIGYREYPKYGMISRYFIYKQALLKEAERLARAQVIREKEDIFFLTMQELHDVTQTHQVDEQLIRQRKDDFQAYQALTPPRVLTSDGEVITGEYRRDDLPAGALVGLPVSAGTVEGRARVILDMAEANLEPGDILVTTHTDPSWTPLFVAIKGLVTEVGGLMTHGAVIAREYGVVAVVGVEHATSLIQSGQRIRVHGTDGYVEILR